MNLKNLFLYMPFLLLLLSSCNTTKHLGKKEYLYRGATLELANPKEKQPKSKLQSELLLKVRQQANSKIFGQRFRLWVYQKLRNHHKERGFKHWLKNKIGQPPVLYDEFETERSRLLMEKHLKDNGFLNGRVRSDTLVKDKTIGVTYQIDGQGQFTINEYVLPTDTTLLLNLLNYVFRKRAIKPGAPYRLADINAERIRIKDIARRFGFYEFDQSAVYFYVDTTITPELKLDVHLALQPPTNLPEYQPHILGNITIYPDYVLDQQAATEPKDTIREGQWTMIQSREVVRLKALQEAIAQDSGKVYSQPMENLAINYLLDLGPFKFVNLRYREDSLNGRTILHRDFYLTPNLNQDIGLELEASTERSSSFGTSIGFNYLHRNAFRGAEQFKTGLSFGAETQAGFGLTFFNTLEANFNAGLTIPRLILPFKITKRLKGVIPKTLLNFTGTYQVQNTTFTSATILTEWGYTWKQSRRFQHQFYPLQFTLLRLLNTSDEFNQELLNKPRLRASFNDLAIVAANYRFSYSTQQLGSRKNFLFLNGELETAGNLVTLLAGRNNASGAKKLFGLPISQYARFQGESRFTLYRPKTSLVGRLSLGLALPYGNSTAIPYIRQFFVGGSNSIRGFALRSIGPGSYTPTTIVDSTNLSFFDRVGDVKLEANLEYRFPLFPYVKGAVFLDAGNVWLIGEAGNSLPEGKFVFNRFYRELAIGTGVGFRLDFNVVVIRLDLGIPLKDPSFPQQDRWVIQRFGIKWLGENLKLNLAIGYPF